MEVVVVHLMRSRDPCSGDLQTLTFKNPEPSGSLAASHFDTSRCTVWKNNTPGNPAQRILIQVFELM